MNQRKLAVVGFALLFSAHSDGLASELEPQESRSPASGCWSDSVTGPLVPERGPAICVAEAGPSVSLVREADSSLLLLLPDGGLRDAANPNPDDTKYLRVFDRRSRLIYCPAPLVDPISGSPGRDCLTDPATLVPGPGAFVGVGRTQASVILDGRGAASCPSAVHVVGSVTSPVGDSFDLSAVMVFAEDGSECSVARDEIKLDYIAREEKRRPAPEDESWEALEAQLSELAEMDEDQWTLVDTLSRLDDNGWRLLYRLFSLSPDEFDRFDFYLEQDGAAAVSEDGHVYSPELVSGEDGSSSVVVDALSVKDLINQVLDIVKTLRNRVPFRLPDDAGMRNLYQEIDLSSLREMLDVIKEQIGGALEMINELRDKFPEWEGSDCGANTQCAAFKADLEGLLDQMLDAWDRIQSLACLDNPDLSKRPLPGIGFEDDGSRELFRRLLVEKAPNVVLFALSKMLGLVDGWQTLVDDLMAGLPEELTSFCNEEPAPSVQAAVGDCVPGTFDGSKRCCVLRKNAVHGWLLSERAALRITVVIKDILDAYTTDDKVVCAAGVAAAGGGAGSNVRNPNKAFVKTIEILFDKLEKIIDSTLAERDMCLAADAELERHLASCLVLAQYTFLETDGGRFGEAEDLVVRRKSQMSDAGLGIGDAQQFLDQAAASEGTRQGYDALCCAYAALNGTVAAGDSCRLGIGGEHDHSRLVSEESL